MVPRDGMGLAALLQPGESVLWQGSPEFRGLVPPGTLVMLLAIGLMPLAFLVYGLVMGEWALAVVAVAIGSGIAGYLVVQARRAGRLRYVLTDRRALTLTDGRITAQHSEGTMPDLELRPRGARHGDIVFRWHETRSQKGSVQRRAEGFLGLPEPAPVLARLSAWRAERFAAAAEAMRDFLAAARQGGAAAIEAAGAGRTIAAPALGIAITVPADWRVEVARVAGAGVVRAEPRWEDIAAAAPGWNAIAVRAPSVAAALEVTVAEGALPVTFAQVRDDPWARRLGLTPMLQEPELRVGPWAGFSVAHGMRGASLFGLVALDSPVLLRQVWLDAGARHIHLRLAAEEGALQVQHVLDAMVGTLRPA